MICNVYDEMMKPVAATNHIALQQRYEGLFFKEGGLFRLQKEKRCIGLSDVWRGGRKL